MGFFAKLAVVLGLARPAVAASTTAQAAPEDESFASMRAAFPFEIVTVPGGQALAEWEKLKKRGSGWPVIIGNDEALGRVLEGYSIDDPSVFPMPADAAYQLPAPRSVEEILAAADKIDVPAELQRLFDEEYGDDPFELPEGEWPALGEASRMTLTVDRDIMTGKPFERTHILIVPTDDPTQVPAFLRWGGWNACPAPEVHVAAHRRWRAQYGAEIVGISSDVINMRVARRPATREEALALAREQYLYCSDIVLQGTETLEPLAAGLMESDWWYFWWD